MSDLMLMAVLRMPYDMAMSTELTRVQFYERAQIAADALDAQAEQIAALRAEVERQQQVIIEQGEKLRRIVNLIRGEPPEDESHSTHDAVDLVRGLVMHNDLYAAAVEHETSALRDSCEAKADRIDRLGERVEKDTALMRRALEALEQVAAQPVGLRGYSSRAFVIAELRERVGAAIGEQK